MEKSKNKAADYTADIKIQLNIYGNVQNIMCYFNKKILTYEHKHMPSNKATGVDKVTKKQYECNLKENMANLVKGLKSRTYKPQPVRRAYIPKLNGDKRPLGIPSYQDKLVQSLMAKILNIIYEPIFLNCSFGFRPNLTCHSALREITHIVTSYNVNYIVETDIKHFFDEVNHRKLVNMLKLKIKDRYFIYYINKFLKAGVMIDVEKVKTKCGTPQRRTNITYFS